MGAPQGMEKLFEWADRAATVAAQKRAFVGFDGFVDEMACVVRTRSGPESCEPVRTIPEFAALVSGAAGRNLGREMVIRSVEPGGNAPNLGEGLMALGVGVDFCGTIGRPVHPVFSEFARRCGLCVPLGDAHGRTVALEFADGKLMFNITAGIAGVDGAALARALDEDGVEAAAEGAALIGLANWSCFPHMSGCWSLLEQRVLRRRADRPWVLVDLADPSARTNEATNEMLEVLTRMQRSARVVLGLNVNEATVLGARLGLPPVTETEASVVEASAAIRGAVGVEQVVVHSQRFAAASSGAGSESVRSLFTDTPVRTTGVGDRFNAGYAFGLLGGDGGVGAENRGDAVVRGHEGAARRELRACLLMGVGAAGVFVRTGRAGQVREILELLRGAA